MKSLLAIASVSSILLASSLPCQAYTDKALYAGLGYFSENSLGKATQSASGDGSTLGTGSYHLLFKYDINLADIYFFSPAVTYTPVTRDDPGGSAKVTIWQIVLPFGTNFGSSTWDWSFGPGILNRTIKGAGGTVQLANGSGVSTFALPGRSVSTQTVTLNLGSSYSYGSSRFGFDLVTEGALSAKRSMSFMFTYSYNLFGGGLF